MRHSSLFPIETGGLLYRQTCTPVLQFQPTRRQEHTWASQAKLQHLVISAPKNPIYSITRHPSSHFFTCPPKKPSSSCSWDQAWPPWWEGTTTKTKTGEFREMIRNSFHVKVSQVQYFTSEQHCFPKQSQYVSGAVSHTVSLFLIVQQQACWSWHSGVVFLNFTVTQIKNVIRLIGGVFQAINYIILSKLN